MKKTLLLVFLGLVSFALAGCGPQKSQPTSAPVSAIPPSDKSVKPAPATMDEAGQNDSDELNNWNDYGNPKYNYNLKYPEDWFFLEDGCCPPPPAAVNFNKFSSKRAELGEAQATSGGSGSIGILCLYEADIDEIGEVQLYKQEGTKNELFEVNGFSGIKFTRQSGPGSNFNVLTHYLSNPGVESCRITFLDVCKECEKILGTFRFSTE